MSDILNAIVIIAIYQSVKDAEAYSIPLWHSSLVSEGDVPLVQERCDGYREEESNHFYCVQETVRNIRRPLV